MLSKRNYTSQRKNNKCQTRNSKTCHSSLDIRLLLCSYAVVMLACCCLFAAEAKQTVQQSSPPVRYKAFFLKHISARQGSKFLADAGISTVSQIPGSNTLLVTAKPAELIKASAILKLVDADEAYVTKAILPAHQAKELPSNDKIAAKIGDISIETFTGLIAGNAKARAIIDVHNNAVIVVAPAGQFERIVSAINSSLAADLSPLLPADSETQVKSDRPQNTNEPDEFFDELLNSLAEAEKMAAELTREPAEPNEAEITTVPAEPNKPEAARPIEKPAEPNLPEVEQLTADLAAEKPQKEPDLEVEGQPEPSEPQPATRSYQPQPIADANEVLKLFLPEKLSIVELLGLVGEHLHLDYMYDPAKVRGDVALMLQGKLSGPLRRKDLYPLLESVLKFRGFVMTRKGNLVTIVPAAEVLNIDPILLSDEEGKVEYGDVVVTRVFRLKYIDTDSAKNLLSARKLGADVGAIRETGTLIVTGYAYRMGRVEQLLEMIDKPGLPKEFRFRQLKYTMAETLAPKVKTLAEQLGTVSITIAAAPAGPITRRPGESTTAFRARQRAAAARRPAAAAPAVAKPTVYLDADERTNRILMIGLEEQLDAVDSLIDSLDVAQQDLRTLRLYEIQNVGADEVMKKLKELGVIGGDRVTAPARPSKSK